MTNFDQRYQNVEKQYNAGHDITVYQHIASNTTTTIHQKRNRSSMLKRVHTFWIKGVLEQSLHNAALIALGLQEKPDMIINPWKFEVQESNQPVRLLPPGTHITQVFDTAESELLILGEPGSGKTTLLLELARDLLDRASQDDTHPIPVIFNLSSWALRRQPIISWLIEELNTKYQVPCKVGKLWIEADEIMPLFDGLDEIVPEHRTTCVEAINSYRGEHGLLPIAVCSRTNEYVTQKGRMLLRCAIIVQPLTILQINEYLSSAREQLEAVRVILSEDATLQELATTPLMLSVLTLTYQGKKAEDLPVTGSLKIRQTQVFAAYVEHMLQRRRAEARYTPTQTKQWLAWLASQLIKHNQTDFYIERMQVDWLEDHKFYRFSYQSVTRGSIGLICGLLGGVVSGLTTVLSIMLLFSQRFGETTLWFRFFAGSIVWLFAGLIVGLTHQMERDIKPAEVVNWSWKSMWQSLVKRESRRKGLVFGLIFALVVGLPVGLTRGLYMGLIDGVIIGPFGGLIGGWVSGAISELFDDIPDKQPHTTPNRQRRHSVRNRMLVGLVGGLIVGLIVSLDFGLIVWLVESWPAGLVIGLLAGLVFGPLTGLIITLTHPAEIEKNSVEMFAWLWKGIWQKLAKGESLRNGLTFGLGLGLFFGLLSALNRGVIVGLHDGVLVGLFLGMPLELVYELTIGLVGGLSSEMLEKQILIKPNQGIHDSARNSIFVGLVAWIITGLLIGLLIGLLVGLDFGLSKGLAFGLHNGLEIGLRAGLAFGLGFVMVAGLVSGLSIGLSHGGSACIQHVVLRLFLWHAGYIPWNYIHFLDYSTERILLHKVGGGYIFVHRLLLDYFASLQRTIPTAS